MGIRKLLLGLVALLTLSACQNTETTDEAILTGVWNKHMGEGPDTFVFMGGALQVQDSNEANPNMSEEEIEELGGSEEAGLTEVNAGQEEVYENIDIEHGEDGEIIIIHEGEEIFRFYLDENNHLRDENGTVYINSAL